MLPLSSVKYPSTTVVKNVVAKIPNVDWAKSDARNVIAIIMSLEKEVTLRLGTKHGILNQLYAKNHSNQNQY